MNKYFYQKNIYGCPFGFMCKCSFDALDPRILQVLHQVPSPASFEIGLDSFVEGCDIGALTNLEAGGLPEKRHGSKPSQRNGSLRRRQVGTADVAG